MMEPRTLVEGDLHSYSNLVDSFMVEILLEEHDNDYQGSSFYLLRDGTRIGHLTFGWGSCSGCDALQAVDGLEELVDLRDDLLNGIRWFDSPQDALTWLNDTDHDLQHYGHDRAWPKYLAAARLLLEELTAPSQHEVDAAIRSIRTDG